MSSKKPNWILLKECAEKLTKEGKVPFTRRLLIDCVHEKHPGRGEGSLNPMIQGMTVNRKGGAPGGIDKNVFYSVNRGLFELYDPAKHSSGYGIAHTVQQDERMTEVSEYEESKDIPIKEERNATEDEIRDLLMQVLYHKLGKESSWEGSGKTASFDLRDEFVEYKCFAERPLSYALTKDIKINHTSDILISNEKKNRYVSIEIKHRSAVTDQFKCRSTILFISKRATEIICLG